MVTGRLDWARRRARRRPTGPALGEGEGLVGGWLVSRVGEGRGRGVEIRIGIGIGICIRV